MISFDVCQCGAPLQRRERPTPKPEGTQVLLKTLAAGICHSDLHIWDGYYEMGGGKRLQLLDRGIKLPLTMGHEIAGEVVAVGHEAKGVKVGDRRLAYPWIGCGACNVCKAGDEHLCSTPGFWASSPTAVTAIMCWCRTPAISWTSMAWRLKMPRRWRAPASPLMAH